MQIMITGANGFIGRALTKNLCEDHVIHACISSPDPELEAITAQQHLINLQLASDWSKPLQNIQVVIHCAARVHVMHDDATDPLASFRCINTKATLNLARQAAAQGVKRFIYLSSIKVNGEQTLPGSAFTAEDQPAPSDPYAQSKYETEQGLFKIAEETGLQIVIIRPAIVYGPNVKGNFAKLIKAVDQQWPLPLASINNQRSLLALDNLTDFVTLCLDHPMAAGQVFLLADSDTPSTPELISVLAHARNKPCRLLPAPVKLLNTLAKFNNKTAVINRLVHSLVVDIQKNRQLLNWQPRLSLSQAIHTYFSDYEINGNRNFQTKHQ